MTPITPAVGQCYNLQLATPRYHKVRTTNQPEHSSPVIARNEASKGLDTSSYLIIAALLILFSFSMRHLNDFFNGGAVTLVSEGTWGERFRHTEVANVAYQTRIDSNFDQMFTQLEENEERIRLRTGRPLEEGWDVNVDTDD
uniref:Uncharacterized protein n=1 Tax=Plectus sambesii TaxID=2011161 RepID=A0A914VSK0_9BILA